MKKALTSTLVALVCLAFTNSVRAGGNDQCFLKIEGIQGESTNENHPNEIVLVGFRTGLMQKVIAAGSGAGVGKVDFSPLKVFKNIDKASVPIFVACAVGKHLKTVTLSVVRYADFPSGAFDYFVVVLSDVFVSSVNDGTETTDSEGNLLETVTFDFTKIEWTYKPQNEDGSPGTPVKGGYDLKLNRKL
jgi:type VI secretion system secreted protein Hcp